MSYGFLETKDMEESHLMNTIMCTAISITPQRKEDCRQELIKRWTCEKAAKRSNNPVILEGNKITAVNKKYNYIEIDGTITTTSKYGIILKKEDGEEVGLPFSEYTFQHQFKKTITSIVDKAVKGMEL